MLAGTLLLWATTGTVAAQLPLRRFLITVSANEGGPGRATLAYAHSDAESFHAVLEELGGVARGDVIRLTEPRVEELEKAFADLAGRLASARQSGARVELVFYYSGHSDDQGLLLGRARLRYSALRSMLEKLPADVRIGVLDSCASGALTRKKGGARRPAFLYDRASQVIGHAFLTSASEDEAAQESDRIRGSFFTHYLVSGLRGAADSSGDRRVTLTEAYRYAFEETLHTTGSTVAGAQHAAYDMQLSGTGDLVLTDLRGAVSEVRLGQTIGGRVFVWDSRGGLVAEVDKPGQRELALALPEGNYRFVLSGQGTQRVATIKLRDSQPVRVESAQFTEVSSEWNRTRGGGTYAFRPFAASLIPPYATLSSVRSASGAGDVGRAPKRVGAHFDLALIYDDPDAIAGLGMSLGGIRARDYVSGVQLGLGFADTSVLWGLSVSGFVSVVRDAGYGVQFAGLIAFAGFEARGLQLAPVNFARELVGAQLSLGMSLVARHGLGLQSAALNFARSLRGAQIGAVNLARHVRGIQVGAVNVAASEVRGLQVGVVNYADDADVSLAVIGITRKGGVHPQLTIGDNALLTAALRFDARYNYSFVAGGLHPLKRDDRTFSLGAGLGAKAPLFRELMWLDIDLGAHALQALSGWRTGLANALFQLRAMVRVDLHRHLSVLAGPTLSVLVQRDPMHRLRPGFAIGSEELTESDSSTRVVLWPGFVAGLRL